MQEPETSELLIGHDEREWAFEALAAHLKAGRLTTEEYGERAETLNAARTRGEVHALFTDLPLPGPRFEDAPGRPAPSAAPTAAFSGEVSPVPVPVDGTTAPATPADDPAPLTTRERWARASVPLGAAAAVGLSFTTGQWALMFLMPPLAYAAKSVLRGGRPRPHSRPR